MTYDPSTPLRHDATEAEFHMRVREHLRLRLGIDSHHIANGYNAGADDWFAVARELAAAQLAHAKTLSVFPDESYSIPLMQRLEGATIEFRHPRLGIASTGKHTIPLTTEEAKYLLALAHAFETPMAFQVRINGYVTGSYHELEAHAQEAVESRMEARFGATMNDLWSYRPLYLKPSEGV